AIDAATSDWILVVDADERVSNQLATSVLRAVDTDAVAYAIPIQNYFYGHVSRWGGCREHPVRLFRRGAARYDGDIHETLIFADADADADADAATGTLAEPLAHFSHRSI